jgi:hypothetical protein
MKLYYLDKLGWPVERVTGRWFLNFLRLLIHTRKITTRRPEYFGTVVWKDNPKLGNCCSQQKVD